MWFIDPVRKEFLRTLDNIYAAMYFTTSPNPSFAVHLISDETVQKLTSYGLSTKLESTDFIILLEKENLLSKDWQIPVANQV